MAIVTEILANLALWLFVCFGVQAHQRYYDAVGSEFDSKSDNFLYAQCKQFISERLDGSIVNCTVFIGTSNVRSCIIKQHADETYMAFIFLQRFDGGKIAMMMESISREDHTTIYIHNVDDCSLIHQVKYSNDSRPIAPLLHRKGFEIFIQRNETICAGVVDYSCRVSFDTEGNRVGDPVPFKYDLTWIDVWTLAPELISKGFIISGYDEKESKEGRISLAIKRVESTGKTIDLISSEEALYRYDPSVIQMDPFYWPGGLSRMRLSNAHEYFGVCWDNSSGGVDCRQFDADNKVRLNVSALVLADKEKLIGVHNLADHVMLIVTKIGKNTFQIRRLDAAGVFGRARKVTHQCSEENPYPWPQITENEEELILYNQCYSEKSDDLFKINFLRLPKKDFI